MATDDQGVVRFWNPGAIRIFGFTEEKGAILRDVSARFREIGELEPRRAEEVRSSGSVARLNCPNPDPPLATARRVQS